MDANGDRISQLEARIDELEARLRAAEGQREQSRRNGPAPDQRSVPTAGDRPGPDRRTMLRTLGLAGAAVAAGTAAAATAAAPAAAADGDAVLLGETNTQDLSETTTIKYTSATAPNGGNVVTVADTDAGLGSFFPASLAGYAFGRVANGVYGYTAVAGGRGVAGVTDDLGATGVGVYGKTGGTDASGIVGESTAMNGSGAGVKGTASGYGGVGVRGDSTNTGGTGPGVLGTSPSVFGVGVRGIATSSLGDTYGVWGAAVSPTGTGVIGWADGADATGVRGKALGASGTGVEGIGNDTGINASSGRTQLHLTGVPVAPLGAGLARAAGEIVFDANQDLWVCVAAGTPGTWKRIAGPSTAGAFVPLPAPVRVYDSRVGFLPATGPKAKLAPGTPRAVDCTANSSGVPVGASGVLVNLVATGVSVAGDMAIYKDGIPYPGTSNLNFAGGQTVAVTTFSALSASGKVAVRSNVGPEVVLDVLGYYQ